MDYLKSGLLKDILCLVFRPPFKNQTIDNQTCLDHLKTRLVWYSDGKCTSNGSSNSSFKKNGSQKIADFEGSVYLN